LPNEASLAGCRCRFGKDRWLRIRKNAIFIFTAAASLPQSDAAIRLNE
jgi:hypothetical protein